MLRKKLQKEKLNTVGVEELINCYSEKEFVGNHKIGSHNIFLQFKLFFSVILI